MQNKKVVLLTIIVLIAVFAIGSNVYKQNVDKNKSSLTKEQQKLLVRDYSIVTGSSNAKVELVEFFDPACGTCAQFHFYVKDIMKKHEGQIKLVYRYAPFHKNAQYAVKMLEGANSQGKFNEVLELMFVNQRSWIDHHVVDVRKLWILLERSNLLDMKLLSQSMENIMIDKKIEQELSDIKALNITKTPTYFVNGVLLEEFSLDNLTKLIESQL